MNMVILDEKTSVLMRSTARIQSVVGDVAQNACWPDIDDDLTCFIWNYNLLTTRWTMWQRQKGL